MKILELLQESNGQLSSMRVMSYACVATAIFLAVDAVIHNKTADTELILTFLVTGFGGKIAQKGFEQKTQSPLPAAQ